MSVINQQNNKNESKGSNCCNLIITKRLHTTIIATWHYKENKFMCTFIYFISKVSVQSFIIVSLKSLPKVNQHEITSRQNMLYSRGLYKFLFIEDSLIQTSALMTYTEKSGKRLDFNMI